MMLPLSLIWGTMSRMRVPAGGALIHDQATDQLAAIAQAHLETLPLAERRAKLSAFKKVGCPGNGRRR